MLMKQMSRLFHTSHAWLALDKNSLAALRKKTGYTFANCKKALEVHNNDLVKAEEWLTQQAQQLGWSKATKLEGRSTKQGLIGVLIRNNIGAMVEVNCETDFVARNINFQEFVTTVSKACTDYVEKIEGNAFQKILLNQDELKSIRLLDGKTLGDHLALMIGNVGENATMRRAICFKSPSSIHLCGYAHPTQANEISLRETQLIGKYGSIVAFKSQNTNYEIQRNLCQHIVGMKPSKIGIIDIDKPNDIKDDENCLIYQEYLLDSTKTIQEILNENEIEIIAFQRFECGESDVENLIVAKAIN